MASEPEGAGGERPTRCLQRRALTARLGVGT